MSGPHSTDQRFIHEMPNAEVARARREEPMDDEEKILANRPDANIPAFLTRDVLGG